MYMVTNLKLINTISIQINNLTLIILR